VVLKLTTTTRNAIPEQIARYEVQTPARQGSEKARRPNERFDSKSRCGYQESGWGVRLALTGGGGPRAKEQGDRYGEIWRDVRRLAAG